MSRIITFKRIFFIIILLVYPPKVFLKNTKNVEHLHHLNRQYLQVRILIGEKKFKEAIQKCKHIIKNNSNFTEIYPLLAFSSKKMNQLNTTITYLINLKTKEPKNTFFLYGLAQCYKNQGNRQKTMELLKEAVSYHAQNFFVYSELVGIGKSKNEIASLIDFFKTKTVINPGNPFLFYALGSIYQYKLKKFDTAFKYYHQAVKIANSKGIKKHEAGFLNTIGYYYWARSNYSKALDYFQQAVETAHADEYIYGESKFLYNCGLMHCHLGHWARAKEYYIQALRIDREIGNKLHEANMLRSIGFCYHRSSNYSQALAYFKKALQISKKFFDKNSESRYLEDIARVFWSLGRYSQAIHYQKQALIIAQDLGNKMNQSTILDSIGSTYSKTGHYAKALEYYFRALKLSRDLGKKKLEVDYLGNIGNIYGQIGNYSKALETCQKALKYYQEIGDKVGIGMNLSNIGTIYHGLGHYSQAIKYKKQALKIAQELGDRKAEALRLHGIAYMQQSLNHFSEALACHKKTLKIAVEIGDKHAEALALMGFGNSYYGLKDYNKSRASYHQTLALAKELGFQEESWLSLYGLALIYEKQHKYDKALSHYKRAIKFIEGVRSHFVLKELKASFLKQNISVYESLIYLLFKLHLKHPLKGYDKDAFYYMEKAKARAFLDSLQEVKVNLKESLSSDLLVEEQKILKDISEIQTSLIKIELTDSERSKLLKQLAEKEESYLTFIRKIKKSNPEYANLVYPKPQQLKAIQEKLTTKGTALIEYFIGDEKALVSLITVNDHYIYELRKSKDLQEEVNDYITLLSAKGIENFDSFAAGHKLYQDLIGPFRNKLAMVKKLIIVPDRNLHYLPFEALVSQPPLTAPKFMVEDYKISYAPSSSSLLHLLQRGRISKAQKDLLAFADPVYGFKQNTDNKASANRISREAYLDQGFIFNPLKYSGQEVKKISRLIKAKLRDIYVRQEAREEKIKDSSLDEYKIIHFATHGLLDEKFPMRSSLVLSLDQDPREDGFYQVREIYNTKLNSDLVVLSACQTGKGKLEKGEGVSGLSRAFLYAGAQSVLVSLWNINDQATCEFMGYFYESLVAGKSKEEALQLAKIKMTNSKSSHPFFWAPFVLIGDHQSPVNLTKPGFWERIF